MMSLNILGVSYDVLLGLGIIMDIDTLKYEDQCPKLIQALAIFRTLSRYAKFFKISFRCLYDNLSSLGIESLLHLLIANINSSLEKGGHFY